MNISKFRRSARYRRWIVRRWRRLVRYPFEAVPILLGYHLCRLAGIDRASAVGGALGRLIGPRLGKSRSILRRIRHRMPELTETQAHQVLEGCWENLGRVIAEFPHVARLDLFSDERVVVEGVEHVDFVRDDGRPGILFSAHMANWELLPFAAAQRGVRVTAIYRHANNPVAENLLRHARKHPNIELLRKADASGQVLTQRLRQGGHLALLVDQKLRQGMPVPFLGREAMTAPTPALLAIRFRCPLVPAHVVRLNGPRFRLIVEPPLELPDTGDHRADVRMLLERINSVIEGWVRAHPEQWLWQHRRWPED